MMRVALAAWVALLCIFFAVFASKERQEPVRPEDFRRGPQEKVEHWACWGNARCRLCECAEEAPDGCVRRVCSETCVECEVKP